MEYYCLGKNLSIQILDRFNYPEGSSQFSKHKLFLTNTIIETQMGFLCLSLKQKYIFKEQHIFLENL